MFKKIIIAIIFLSLFASPLWAGSLSLKWNAVPEPDVGGYKLYYIEEGTPTEQFIDVGTPTSHVLTGLITGKDYEVWATAYDLSGNESEPSYKVKDKANYSIPQGLEIIK